MPTEIKNYNAKIDTKKRVTLRNAKYDNYHVKEYDDGRIILEPRILVPPFEISEKTLNMMDSAIDNFKKERVSDPIDLSSKKKRKST